MSGLKRATIRISEQEYRRLQEAEATHKYREQSSSRDEFLAQREILTGALHEMESRQYQLEAALGDLNYAGAEAIQELIMQNAEYQESMARMIEETGLRADDSFILLSQEFSTQLETERELYRHHIEALHQRLGNHEQEGQSKAESAKTWLQQCRILADFIQSRYDHERFLPGRLARALPKLELAQDNLMQGFAESCLQTSQQTFLDLTELRFELEQRLLEWQHEYGHAHLALSHFIKELEQNRSVTAVGLDGEELNAEVDVDYWTNGRYFQLVQSSQKLLTLLSHDQEGISTEELIRTHRELLPIMRNRFRAMVGDARLSALNSQLRMNIAEKALEAFETQGFTLNKAGYTDDDMRTAFLAQLASFDGSLVSINVLPPEKPGEGVGSDIVIATTHPFLKTEQEARLQWEEISQIFRQQNLSVSNISISETPPAGMTNNNEPSPSSQERLNGSLKA